jgi:hypothetical protein
MAIRINAVDADLELVNGVNITVWRPSGELSEPSTGWRLDSPPAQTISTGSPLGWWRPWSIGGRAGSRSADSPPSRTARSRDWPFQASGTVANSDINGIAIAGLGTSPITTCAA